MAVSSLQALNVIGLMEHIDEAITALGESGVFQPDDVSNFYDNVQDFTHLQTKNTFAEPLTNLKAALNQTKRSFPLTDVSDFSPSVEDLENFSAVTTADIDALIDKRETAAAKLNEVRQNLSVTSHFVGMGVEIEKVLKMKYMKARFGRLPKDSMSKLEAYRDNEYVDFAVCTEDKTHCWGVYFAPFDVVEEIDKIFEALFFERCNLVSENETPRERIEDYKKEIPALEANVKKAQAQFNRQISEVQTDGSKKVLEKGWFSRGTKVLITGYRREDTFVAKTYKATPTHQLYRIVKVNNSDITLEHERISVKEQ